jgi:hypothetical protein
MVVAVKAVLFSVGIVAMGLYRPDLDPCDATAPGGGPADDFNSKRVLHVSS